MKTTWVCKGIPELDDAPVCPPKSGRMCFEFLKFKGAQPKSRMDDDEVLAERRVFDDLNQVVRV